MNVLTRLRRRWCLRVISLLALSHSSMLLAENPFGGGESEPPPPPPPASAPMDDNDYAGGESFGFTPPPNQQQAPSAPQAPIQTMPRSAGNSPALAPGRPDAQPGNAKGAPALADYLQLDSAVKGLQVKNFDLPDKDIKDVVTLISKWTGKNFILDSKVRGKITIMGPSQVTLQEAYQAFLSSLDANGLTTIQSGKFIRIIESAEARRAPVQTYAGDFAPNDDQFITRIFQLKYINSDEVQREFRDLTTRQGKLFAYEPTNSLIITDTGSNIQRLREILDSLDVKNFETSLHVLRIRNNSAKTISDMLGAIYGNDQKGGPANRSFRRSVLERTRGGGIITKIIPEEQTNSLIVLANRSGFNSLVDLVAKLDIKSSDTGRIHVYYCEHAKAEDLASTLASLSGGGKSGGTKKPASPSGGAPGATLSPASVGPVSAELEGGVKITSDAATNALVITANSSDYQTLKRVIRKLDIPRLQVFIETAIVELSLSGSDKWSPNYVTGLPGGILGPAFIGDADAITRTFAGGVPGEGLTGFAMVPPTYSTPLNVASGSTVTSVSVPIPTFGAILSIISKSTDTSILSTPQIIALDNEKAIFKAQDDTPVFGNTTAATATSGATQNIERLKTGIEMSLTPHVNAASRMIRLEIEQTVDTAKGSAGVPQELANKSFAKSSRVTNTQVVVKDGDYVMLGGLISDKIDDIITKVPLLGDIPILGWLFKARNLTSTKTNLIILLHPRIIGSSLGAANLISDNIKKRDEFIDQNSNSSDHFKTFTKDLKKDIHDQIDRGKLDLDHDYRNNNDDEETPKVDDNSYSKILNEPEEKVAEKPKAPTPVTAPPTAKPATDDKKAPPEDNSPPDLTPLDPGVEKDNP
ncbi:MAG: type II secretion system secretin GspD [Deltaproteobacteria bacterium]|nr:type II secretion system secretin GspD [Deltaproteobacteria bacterium]MBI3293841.1 type II secretion system secretin GspD [Deltaproteobacteria bacterium]